MTIADIEIDHLHRNEVHEYFEVSPPRQHLPGRSHCTKSFRGFPVYRITELARFYFSK